MRENGGKVIGWGLGSSTLTGRFSGLRLKRRKDFIRHFDALITYSQAGAEETPAWVSRPTGSSAHPMRWRLNRLSF
jgi:hypothetical protein